MKSYTVKWHQIEPSGLYKPFEMDFHDYWSATIWIWDELKRKENRGWFINIQLYENTLEYTPPSPDADDLATVYAGEFGPM